MKHTTRPIALLRLLLLSFVVVGSIAAILACNGNDDCVSVGESCSENSDCCSHHCEGGRCCRGIGAALDHDEPASNCCSGQIRTGSYGPYCCGTAGTVVSRDDKCCAGLARDDRTGECTEPSCEPPCVPNPQMTVGGDPCVCPPGIDLPILPCSPCGDPSESECWIYRVYNEGYMRGETGTGCRGYGPFSASDAATAEACARWHANTEGFPSNPPWVVEEYSGLLGPPENLLMYVCATE
jgi:hypothetical protein